MLSQQYKKRTPRLGNILIQRSLITPSQLIHALQYQSSHQIKLGSALVELNLISRSQLNRALRKQSWTRMIAASIAFICSPCHFTFAADSNNIKNIISTIKMQSNFYDNLTSSFNHLSPYNTQYHPNNRYSKHFTLSKMLSNSSGVQLDLLSANTISGQNQLAYSVLPQVSFFKSFFDSPFKKTSNFYTTIRPEFRTRSTPAIFMLSLKGRSLFQSTAYSTTVAGLHRTNQGVQKKAQLMFSITKQF